jgi:hypothetical protein
MMKFGYVFASKMLVDNRLPVLFMYREHPDGEDSGWRFLCGLEDRAYLDDPDNIGIYDLQTILDIDPSIEIFLGSLPRRAYERKSADEAFTRVMDFDFDEADPDVRIEGTALTSRMLVEQRLPVMIMYRVEPNENDTGWRFFSGLEDDAYMEDPDHLEFYDIRTILELNPEIEPYLELEGIRAYERTDPNDPHFQIVTFADIEDPDETDHPDGE